MRTRTFGKTGWDVSEIGFGAWAIGGSWGAQKDSDSLDALRKALELGVTFIDTAQGYGNGRSETIIGQLFKERGQKLGGGPIKVATKVPPTAGAWPPLPGDVCAERYPEAYLRERVEFSLRNLKAEALDILQLHTWTRAWNDDPVAVLTLQKLKKEGKILALGISTPEHDQDSFDQLIKAGLLDSVQVIYNIFEQEPEAELLPAAKKHGVGVIVRVVFDESSLTGKFTAQTKFPDDDFRSKYFRGDRLAQTIERVEAVKKTVAQVSGGKETNLASVAVRFALRHPAVSTVITGIRSVDQAVMNCGFSAQPPLTDELYLAVKKHYWRRAFWYE